MEMPQGDFDRLLFFEYARKTAETNYAKNPLDADVTLSLPNTGFKFLVNSF